MNLRNKLPAFKYRKLGLVVLPLDIMFFYIVLRTDFDFVVKSCIQLIIIMDILLCLIALFIGDTDKE